MLSLAYSPDGETLAFVTGFDFGAPGYLRVIDVQTRELLAEASDTSAPDVAFTGDGSLLVLTEYVAYGSLGSPPRPDDTDIGRVARSSWASGARTTCTGPPTSR